MSFLRNILYLMLVLPLLATQSCSSDNPAGPDVPSGPDIAGYLQLTVHTAGNQAGSRATADSEDGDGRENGRNNENNIYNLSIFIYNDLGDGLDNADNPIVWSYYLSSDTKLNLLQIKVPLTKDELINLGKPTNKILRTVVVANAGDLTQKNIETLRDLCWMSEDDFSSAWTGDKATDADRFVMSSAFNGARRTDSYRNDGRVFFSNTDIEGIVYSCETTLERVAARIDLQFSDGVTYNDDKSVTYRVKKRDDDGTETDLGHTVTLLNIVPVNLMQQNSYLVKHLSEDSDVASAHLIAADETRSNGIPDRYVFCPSFTYKVNNMSDFNIWFGKSRASILSGLTPDNFESNEFTAKYRMENFGAPFTVTDNGINARAITITYANENTHPREIQREHQTETGTTINPADFLTGLLFRAQYHPSEIFATSDISEENAQEYKDGDDFWLCREFTDPAVPKHLYFATEEACREYMELNKDAKIFVDPVKYTGGKCFYNVWLKHNILDTDENYPMKYGIVRNNIYRLSVAFKNIGRPDVDIDGPDYEIEYILEVLPWKFGGKVHVPLGE